MDIRGSRRGNLPGRPAQKDGSLRRTNSAQAYGEQ